MLKVSAVFSDHMVLQRGKPIPVWGTAAPGSTVRAELCGELVLAEADADGLWKASFKPKEAGQSLVLKICGDGAEQVFSDVAIGEVWFAGGQSNMEMELANAYDGKKEVSESFHPDIRFYMVPKCAVTGDELDEAEIKAGWKVCGPDTSGIMSAVAYFFAVQIREALSVPVGIICCAYGGTSISCWMSREQLMKTTAGVRYIDEYNALVGDKTDEQYRAEMEDYTRRWEAWNARVEARRIIEPEVSWEVLNEECGICPWPQPAGRTSPFRPAGLHESMVKRVSPYAIRGFLYYQGEEDEARYESYDFMMMSLIDEWRRDFGDRRLPFLFVQLPMYIAKADAVREHDSRYWAMMRDQQMKTAETVANTGLAVLTDCGEFDNIHPTDKKTVGERLALQARKKVYGQELTADAPVVSGIEYAGDRVFVHFQNTDEGLMIRGPELQGFELAGRDGIFFPAEGRPETDSVMICSKDVPLPVYVRYAWKNYCTANLYGATGLPAAPFRTDTFAIR